MRYRVCMDFSDARLVHAIPIFQRSFEISFQEIHGSQKIVAVGIMRIEAQSVPQIKRRLGIVLLFELDAGELQGESLVPRLLAYAAFEGIVSFLPAAELCQGGPIVKIKISRARLHRLQNFNQFLPPLFIEQLLGALDELSVRRGSLGGKVKRKEQEGDQCASLAGRASNVHFPVALHSRSKLERSCLSSLRCAGSFIRTKPCDGSNPVTTT